MEWKQEIIERYAILYVHYIIEILGIANWQMIAWQVKDLF